MGWIFRTGDTRAAKWVTLAFLAPLCVAIVGLLGMHSLLPHPALKLPAAAFGVLFAVFASVALIKDKNPATPFARSGPIKRFCFLILAAMLAWATGFFAVQLGAPYIWAAVALDPKVGTASVTHVFRERSGRGCHHKIELKGGPLPETMTPCVSQELWKALKVGDTVEIRYTDGLGALVVQGIAIAK